MLVKKLVFTSLVLGVLGVAGAAFAQSDASEQKEKTIIDRLDNLGKTLFGGILPSDKSKSKENTQTGDLIKPKPTAKSPLAKPSATAKPSYTGGDSLSYGTRAGSTLSRPDQTPAPMAESTEPDDIMPEDTSIMSYSREQTAKRVQHPTTETSTPVASDSRVDDPNEIVDQDPLPSMRKSTESVYKSDSALTTESPASSRPTTTESPIVRKSFSRPLHERMSGFRQSAFGSDNAAAMPPANEPPQNETPATEPAIESESAAAESVDEEPARLEDDAAPIVAQRPKLTVDVEPAPRQESIREEAAPEQTEPFNDSLSAAPPVKDDEGMLIARKGPVLSVETLGPRRIAVGKESTYEVNMVNLGDVAAEEMVVFISLPEWAEVVGADSSTGPAQESVSSPAVGTLQWKLGQLSAKGRERLTLRIIPRQSRPFDLAVRWEYRPTASQAMIEVQEPKLSLQLEGPREVLYGKKETYRLKLLNVGNGPAENVALMLMPIGGGENVPATHKIGILPAGEEKVLDVELTARQAGNLTIQLDARADGGVHAELSERVLVRRADLKVDVEGPKMQFVGATTTYTIRVSNPGTASAENVNVSVTLPVGAKYVAGLDGARTDSGNQLYWTIKSIGPQVEQMFMVKCRLGSAGVSRVEVNAKAEDDLTATANTVTRVEAVADLTLDVVNPKGPVAIGDEAVYKIHVRNRGTKAAENVEVFAYFSRGIEPTGADGAPSRLSPGQVTFQAIPLLTPGAETTLTIHARADDAGNHVFRAEAHCKPLGTRLISEATNLYYTESSIAQGTTPAKPRDAVTEAMRPESRYQQGQMMPVPPRK